MRGIKSKALLGVASAMGILVAASTSATAAITFSGTGANGRAAQVSFDLVGSDLQVTLTSSGTLPTGTLDSTYMLGGLFFNYTGAGSFTGVGGSAVLNSGSSVVNSPGGTINLGNYWAYDSGLTLPSGTSQGLRAVGYGVGGSSSGNIGATAAQNLNGMDWSLVNFSVATGNDGIPTTSFVNNSIVFTLKGTGLPLQLNAADFSNIIFQYGTALTDSHFSPVPEPATVVTGALLLLPMGASAFRILRKKALA